MDRIDKTSLILAYLGVILLTVVLCIHYTGALQPTVSSYRTCFQEATNSTTDGDGDCGLSYDGTYESRNTSTVGTLYINYTKPILAINSSLWQVRINGTTQNFTIDNNCMNNGNKLTFKVESSVNFDTTNAYIRLYCLGDGVWKPEYNDTLISGSWAAYTAPQYVYRMYDKTYASWSYAFFLVNTPFAPQWASSATANLLPVELVEEAMVWNITSLRENNQTYSPSAYISTNNNFKLNLTYDNTIYNINASLNYNNTIYPSTLTYSNNGNIEFSANVVSPSVAVSNITFYWNIALSNSTDTTYYNSTFYNQTVNLYTPITANASCPAGLTPAFNFTSYNEITKGAINVDTTYNIKYGYNNYNEYSLNGSLTNVGKFSICINNSAPYYYLSYGEVNYNANGYVPRRFYLFANTRITNVTILNNLYDLDTTNSTSFLITAETSALQPYVNYYVGLLRWYPDLNNYVIVETGKTDDKGQTILHVKTEDVDYRLALYASDGTLIKLLSPIRLICQTNPCTYSLFADASTTDLSVFDNIQNDLTYDSTSKTFTFVWNDPSQTPQTMNLTVYQVSSTDQDILCSNIAQGYTGVLTCRAALGNGHLLAEVTRTASPSKVIAQLTTDINQTFVDVGGGTIGLFIGAILLIFFALIGAFNPVLVVILGIISLVPLYLLGNINWEILAAIGVIGGIILHSMRKTT